MQSKRSLYLCLWAILGAVTADIYLIHARKETANAKLDSQAKPGEGQRIYFAVRLAR